MKDSFGLTALDLADRNRHEGCVNILKNVAGNLINYINFKVSKNTLILI